MTDTDQILNYLSANYEKTNLVFESNIDKIKYYITKYFIKLPDHLNYKLNTILKNDILKNKIINVDNLKNQINLIQCDITQIKCDCIVNAANSDGLGCFEYKHKCIDNIIHCKAGPQLRIECFNILNGSKILTSNAIITNGYNLPAKYIIHVVGPIYDKSTHDNNVKELINCYINCLNLAITNRLNNIVFCCISTGVYGFPQEYAAFIAIDTVKKYIIDNNTNIKVIFCTYNDKDYQLYNKIINK